MSQKAYRLIYINMNMGFGGSGGSEMVMGEWLVGQLIVGVISFQRIFGLCGLKGYIVEIRLDVTLEDARNVKIELEIWIPNSQ